jgi:FAD/FMN-containing dehydrogenase
MTDPVGSELAAAIGVQHVAGGGDIAERYRVDVMGKYRSAPAWLAKPGSTGEVAQVMKIAASHGLPVTVVGGQTGTCGGAVASDGGIALSLERMNRIAEIDTVSMTLTVEAGCILQAVQEAVEAEGAFLPLDLGSRGSAMIGGCIAANSGGNRVLRWGMMRDMVIGLEVVLADGTIVSSLTKMIKDNAGFAWKHLMIGSEGTLGVITRAVLRLRPAPVSEQTALVALPSFEAVTALLRSLEVGLGGQLSSFELMWSEFYEAMTEAQLPARARPMDLGQPYYALVEMLGGDREDDAARFERALMGQLEQGVISDAVIAKSGREREALWAMREDMQPGLVPLRPFTVYDVSMALQDMPDFVSKVRERVGAAWPGAKLVFYGHAGDGNLHLIVHTGPEGSADALAVETMVYTAVGEVRGSIAAEHGIGTSRAQFLRLSRSPEELELMARIKQALDPLGILNPGKILTPRG